MSVVAQVRDVTHGPRVVHLTVVGIEGGSATMPNHEHYLTCLITLVTRRCYGCITQAVKCVSVQAF